MMGRLGDADTFSTAWMTENAEISEDEGYVIGRVKWFDAVKGFGFVVADAGGPDILLHANVLRNFGQSSISDSSIVELKVQHTERGIQAVDVLSVAPPLDLTDGKDDTVGVAPNSDAPLIPGRVKWFDKVKGFGFANAYGKSDDVFLHVEVLRRCGLADLQPGEAICMRIENGDRGQMAAEVHYWDYALSHK